MKVCVIQPKYSFNSLDIENRFGGLLNMLDECDGTMDIIVLPEYSDALADVHGKAGLYEAFKTYNAKLLKKAAETAKRCNSLLFVNAGCECEGGLRNTTYFFDRNGELIGKYFKAHPAPSEVRREEEGGYGLGGIKDGYRFEIVTDKPAALSEELISRLKHGVTLVKAHGMYSDTDKFVLICIVNKRQIGEMMKIIKAYPGTFASFEKVNEVFGNFKRKV